MEPSPSRPVPSERAKGKAAEVSKSKSTEAAASRPASAEKAKSKAAEIAISAKAPKAKRTQPPLVGLAGRALSLGGASAKASSVRSVSPLPVRSEALAPAESKSPAIVISDVERPLIALDWRKTISHERAGRRGSSFVPAGNITALRRLQELGYDLGIASFSSAQETLREATDLQASLLRPFAFIAILPQKRLADHNTGKVSITRHSGTKAQLVRDLGCCLFTDGQRGLCQEVESLQSHQINREPLQGCGRCFRSFKAFAAVARRGGEEHSEVYRSPSAVVSEVFELG